MDFDLVHRHRALNRLQSVLLLLAMAGLLVLAGWLFAGALGVLWSLALDGSVVLTSCPAGDDTSPVAESRKLERWGLEPGLIPSVTPLYMGIAATRNPGRAAITDSL